MGYLRVFLWRLYLVVCSHTYLPFYIWSWYIYEIKVYKIHLLLQVWNEIIADNEHKLGQLGESKFIHMTVNGGGL